jgi:hypothetical protein
MNSALKLWRWYSLWIGILWCSQWQIPRTESHGYLVLVLGGWTLRRSILSRHCQSLVYIYSSLRQLYPNSEFTNSSKSFMPGRHYAVAARYIYCRPWWLSTLDPDRSGWSPATVRSVLVYNRDIHQVQSDGNVQRIYILPFPEYVRLPLLILSVIYRGCWPLLWKLTSGSPVLWW